MLVNILKISGTTSEQLELSDEVFNLPSRPDIIARTVYWQLAKRRQGTHSSKGISAVSGTTKKPYKQKGTGRARQGSLRSPQFRGGGIIFGPVVRSHEHSLPKKVRKLALKVALSDKLRNNKLFVCDFGELQEGKTKAFIEAFKTLNLGLKNVLIIDGNKVSEQLSRAAANLSWVDCLPQIGSNVYDILHREGVILTPEAVKMLEDRLK